MSEETNITGGFTQLTGRLGAATSRIAQFILNRIQVHILEMEDVLFHLDSCVMMPERPRGRSSTDGTADASPGTQAQQDQVSGLQALALGLKQFEFDPRKRLLIAGHTDTSGAAQMNFELSAQRARGVEYLMEGDRESWADVSSRRHHIEDYQQIMRWISENSRWGWPTDPIDMDNRWGTNTKNATGRFIENYNTWILSGLAPSEATPLPADMLHRIDVNGEHKWPIEMWRAVYDIYNDEMAAALRVDRAGLGTYRSRLAFADDAKKFVACGESFPIDHAEKDNYRSQTNRRVELLFFDQAEVPVLNCPARVTTVHTETECPLWHNLHFLPVYIDPADLTAVAYHLKFVYFDNVYKAQKPLPEGLNIRVFEQGGNELTAKIQYLSGDNVYMIKVQDDPARTDLFFSFETANKMIFTQDNSTPPAIIDTPANFATLPLTERVKHYDLPTEWLSINYFTRYDGNFETGGRFKNVMQNLKQFKPFGGNTTRPDQPLTFSLDDIVLLDTATGTQNLRDANHMITNLDTVAAPAGVALSARSRVKIIMVDHATGFLKLFQKTAEKKSARVPLPSNLVTEALPAQHSAKIVFFRDGFYTVANKRTRREANFETLGFVVGARAAVRNDNDFMRHWPLGYHATNKEDSFTGDYDLYYFHHLHLETTHPVSYFVYYLSVSFIRDSRPAALGNPIPVQADVLKFVDEGCYNAMERWNKRQRFLDEVTPGPDTTFVKPFFFFDERETFTITDANSPANIDFDTRTNLPTLFNHAQITQARQNAVGGISKCLALVCKDDPGIRYGAAYFNAFRRHASMLYSIFHLNKSAYEDVGTIGGVGRTEFEIDDTYGVFTMAHEFGHTIGHADEYFYTDYTIIPAPGQPGMRFAYYRRDFEPYSMFANYASMMKGNMSPRLHHLWYATHLLNRQIAGGLIPFFPNNKLFQARFQHGSVNLTYHRNLTGTIALPPVLTSAVVSAPNFPLTASPARRLRLTLYDTAQDESSRNGFHPGQNNFEYQAVAVVSVQMAVNFVNDSGTWTGANQATKIGNFQARWMDWGERFRLIGGTKGIQRIYIHFVPAFIDPTDSNFAFYNQFSNYQADFLNSNSTGTNPIVFIQSGRLKVHRNATASDLLRFCLNMAPHQDALTVLQFLQNWVNTSFGDTFTLERIPRPDRVQEEV